MNIRHHIATIRTDNRDDCWAAATAMMMRRHSIAGTDHVKALARAARVPLDQGTLPDSSVPLLARAVKLGLHDFQSSELTMGRLAGLLARGPVVAFGFFQYPGRTDAFKHAVAIFSLVGDGTARGTTISLIDPSATVNPFSDDWEHFEASVADITFALSY
ncbi:MAG: hypothetical protein ABJF23_16220 [Bryobacteraceae bacterium]